MTASQSESLRGVGLVEHTPLPWRISDDGDFLETLDPVELDMERRAIADLRYFHMPFNEANAAFIVRACNSHDALIKALEAAEQHFGPFADITINGQHDPDDVRVVALIRAALSSARTNEQGV